MSEILWTIGAFATVLVAPLVFFSVVGVAALVAKQRATHRSR